MNRQARVRARSGVARTGRASYAWALFGAAVVLWPLLAATQSTVLPPPAPQPSVQAAEPITPLPLSVVLDPSRVALGERLFSDTRLSGDNTRSCASCHPLDKGAMDARARGIATDGQARLRNTPTLFNVGFNFAFNWDGATTTLENHAQRLLGNPAVMNAKWPDLLTKLRADADYPALFAAAFTDGLTQANLLSSLATFERSLITPNARLDRYLRGERQALTQEEVRGYQLFKSYGCVACHQGMNVGGNLFQRFGVFQDPDTLYASREEADIGRYRVSAVDRDRGVFRVPSLRNVALTAPYFHDGRAPTLALAVDTMARVQLGRELSAEEVQAIVRFLETLTGEYQGKPLASPAPGAR
jgi:cytochrome c peroxidase